MNEFKLLPVSKLEFGDAFFPTGGRVYVKSIGRHRINGVEHHDSYAYGDIQVQIRLKAHTVVARAERKFIFCKCLRDLSAGRAFIYSGKKYILIEKMNTDHVIAISAFGSRTKLTGDITVYTQSDTIILQD